MSGKFEIYSDRSGKHRFRLKADTGQVVATGDAFGTPNAARSACEGVKRAAEGAEIVEVEL